MTTFSFDFPLAKTDSDEVFDPGTGYTITLRGDAGKPTGFEWDTLMQNTPRAFIRLSSSRLPQNEKFDVDQKQGNFDHLRSEHYTWHVARGDGQPMQRQEPQFAFLMHAMKGRSEPVFAIPRSTLHVLLKADKSLSEAFAAAISNAQPGENAVSIADPRIAAGLIELDLIVPTSTPDQYLLSDIEVID